MNRTLFRAVETFLRRLKAAGPHNSSHPPRRRRPPPAVSVEGLEPRLVLSSVTMGPIQFQPANGSFLTLDGAAGEAPGNNAQLPLPQTLGQTFVVDSWNYDVTQNDLGFNDFNGNTGATESVEGTTTLHLSPESNGPAGGSLDISYDFSDEPDEVFAGYFASLFGLTDTLVSLDGSGMQPEQPTPFPGYFLDTQDLYRGFLPLANRSVDQLQFDLRLESDSDITIKIELQDENGFDVFTRRTLTSTGDNWQTITLALPASFTDSVDGNGNPSAFNWRAVSTFSLIVERNNDSAGVHNPQTGRFLLDNLELIDSDGSYPDLEAIRDPQSGGLLPEYTNAFLDDVRGRSAQFFTDWASTDPRTGGIIQDRSTFADLMTVGGVGFQLTTYVIDAEQGYMTRTAAATRTRDVLRVLHDHPQGPEDIGTIGYEGFFYHFLGIDGLRKQNFDFTDTPDLDESLNTVELSTIDTALAVAGAVTSAQFFDAETPLEAEIRQLADEIYARIDWNFMVDPESHQFYLGWKPNETRDDDSGRFGRFKINDDLNLGQYSSKPGPEEAEVPATLDYYSDEGILIALLAMASPNPEHRVSREVWDAMIRETGGGSFVRSYPGSLFTYEFASVWLDTAALGTDNHQAINGQPATPLNFFDNSRAAVLSTIDYATSNPNERATWSDGAGANRWGLSAAEGPFDAYLAYASPTAALANDAGFVALPGSFSGEAEDGTGNGLINFRSNATGGMSVLLNSDESRTISVDVSYHTEYQLIVRYSNDNFGPLEQVDVQIDGQPVGSFAAQDTGDFGEGWDSFAESDLLGPITLLPGTHLVTISVSGGDGGGVELDHVDLQHGLILKPLEDGTTTIYGAGSAIGFVPESAIAALWDAVQLGLLHPRFGYADAYNLEVSDAVVTETVGGNILRTSGAWASFAGFSIDQGPLAIQLDNYLSSNFVPHLFMSAPNIRHALATVFPDVNDFPVLTSSTEVSVPENVTSVLIVTATDSDLPAQSLTYSISGGADAALFQIDPVTGVLSFLMPSNFDAPADADSDNSYHVQVSVDDGNGGTDSQDLTITVTNVAPQLELVGDDVEWTRREPPVPLFPLLTVGGDLNPGPGTLLIDLNAVGSRRRSKDQLITPAVGDIGTSNGLQYVNGVLSLQIQLRSDVTADDIRDFLRQVKFSTKGKGLKQATRTVEVSLADAGGLVSSITQTIHVHKNTPRALNSRRTRID